MEAADRPVKGVAYSAEVLSWSGLVFANGLLQALDLDAERKFHKSKDHGVISRAERNRNLQPGG